MVRARGRRVGPIQAVVSRLRWGQFRLSDPKAVRETFAIALGLDLNAAEGPAFLLHLDRSRDRHASTYKM